MSSPNTKGKFSNAFIFDMDGVLLNNEPLWEQAKKQIVIDLFGRHNAELLGSTTGLGIDVIYDKARDLGLHTSRKAMHEAFHIHGPEIYRSAPLTPGLKALGQYLTDKEIKIGIVSASPQQWIDIVINRLPFCKEVEYVLSLDKHDELRHKPHPDGYLKAVSHLGATSKTTAVLEDSNNGIASASASGAYTIGLRANLLPGYVQSGADVYAQDLEEVVKLVEEFFKQ